MRYIFILTTTCLIWLGNCYSQSLLNSDFGIAGKTIVNIDQKNNNNYNVAALAVGNDNSVYIGGNLDEFIVQKILANGRDDTSFGFKGFLYSDYGGKFNNGIAEILKYPDGKILLVGTIMPCVSQASRYVSGNGIALIRLLPGGSVDTTFGVRGKVFFTVGFLSLWASTALIQPDGKIVITARGGGFDGANALNVEKIIVAKFNVNGSPDISFGTGGTYLVEGTGGFTQAARKMGLALQPDGKIIIGDMTTGNAPAVFRLKVNGRRDSTFAVNGIYAGQLGLTDGRIQSVVVQPDGKILVAGHNFTSLNPLLSNWFIYRLTSNGQIDNSFAVNGVFSHTRPGGRYQAICHIEMQGNDRILASAFHNTTSQGFIDVFRLKLNGTFDSSFAQSAVIYQQQFLSGKFVEQTKMALDADQNPTVLGFKGQFYVQNDGHQILRLSKDGVIVPLFNGTGVENFSNATGSQILDYNFGSSDKLVGITQFANGKIFLGGNIINDGKIGMVRLTSSGKIDSSFGVNGRKNPMVDNAAAAMTAMLKLNDDKIIFNRNANTLVKIDSTGKIDSTFGTNGLLVLSLPEQIPGFPSSIRALAQQADQKILILSNHYIFRLLATGAIDNSFGINGSINLLINSDQVGQRIECQPDGKIIAAVSGPTGVLLYRCLANGVTDISFGAFSNGKVTVNYPVSGEISFSNIFRDFKLTPDGSIIVICMKNRFFGLDNSAYNDQVIAAGANYRDIIVYKYRANGAIETTFGGEPNPLNYFTTSHLTLPFVEEVPGEMVVTPEGKILISGFFNRGTGWDIGVIQLKANGRYDTTCILARMKTIDEDNFILNRNSISTDIYEYKLHMIKLQNSSYLLGATKHGQNSDYFVANFDNINRPMINYSSFAGIVDPVCFKTNLSWSTNYECNVDSFYIEHSNDSISFLKIGSVKAANNLNGNNYQFAHLATVYGNNFYRVRLFSAGVTYDVSQTIKVIIDNSPLGVINWTEINYNQHDTLFDVELKWQATNELRTVSYAIQLSTDSVNFQTVQVFNAGGSFTETRNYSYTILNLPARKYFFRLQLTGDNCRILNSAIRSIELDGCAAQLKVYPNPVVDDLIIKIPQCTEGDIRLINSIGQTVKIIRHTAGLREVIINCARYSSGVYFLEFIGQQRTIVKIVKL